MRLWAPGVPSTAQSCSKCPEPLLGGRILDGGVTPTSFPLDGCRRCGILSPQPMSTFGYIRPAPGFPLSADEQRAAVVELARREGLKLSRIYTDGPGRGTTGRAALLRSVEERRVSTVVTASICRLGTTWSGVLRFLTVIAEARIGLVIADTADQQRVESLLAAVPTLIDVRSTLHREAAATGRARAKARGVLFGRPRIPEAKINRVREALDAGASIREAGRRAGVSPATVVRVSQRGLNDPSPAMG